jgi:hypothetical protein
VAEGTALLRQHAASAASWVRIPQAPLVRAQAAGKPGSSSGTGHGRKHDIGNGK